MSAPASFVWCQCGVGGHNSVAPFWLSIIRACRTEDGLGMKVRSQLDRVNSTGTTTSAKTRIKHQLEASSIPFDSKSQHGFVELEAS
jgi:hypothetical protein